MDNSNTPLDAEQELITVKEEIGTDEEYERETNMIVEEIHVSEDIMEKEEETENMEDEEEKNDNIDEETERDVTEEEEGKTEMEEEHYIDQKVNIDDINNENVQDRIDLFQQPFAMDYLQKYIEAEDIQVNKSLQMENEYETFVNSRCVCRLCTKTDQTIFMRLFFNDQRMTPIATRIAYLMGNDKVELDLLPQQICLGCSELVDSSYNALIQFSESYQILSDVVAEFRKKTHIFYKKKDKKGGVCLNLSDKGYQFTPKPQSISTTIERINTRQSSSGSVKCYLCMKSFASCELKSHMSESHGCKIEYRCVKCTIPFPTFADLTNHMNESETCGTKQHDVLLNNVKPEYDSDNANDADEEISHFAEVNIVKILEKNTSVVAGTRKKMIVTEHYEEMLKEGKVECRSCFYCKRLFKSDTSEELIKSHILVHLFSTTVGDSEHVNTNPIDIDTLDLTDHLGTTLCYVCTFCKMPKRSTEALRDHLSQFCSTFANKFNLKIRDRRRYGKTRGKPHYCKACADGTPYKIKEYKVHMQVNHPELIMHCMHCPRFFFERSNIQFHIMTKHVLQSDGQDKTKKPKKKGSMLCEFCSRECLTKVGYRLHVMKTHMNPNKSNRPLRERRDLSAYEVLHCLICDKKFQFKEGKPALEFHMKRHEYPNNKVQCCNREYINFEKYKKHLASHSKTWPCKVCNVPFESMVLLQDHVSACHTECKDCGYIAKNYQDHTKHTQQAHGRDVFCEVCNMMFSSKKELMVHRRQFHWEEVAGENGKQDLPEPVLCCGRKFMKKENLKRHTAKHQDTVCKTCGDMLKSKLALLSHNATHHRQQGVECEFCHKTFTNADTLKYHMLRHTQGRQFNCACGLSFYTEADMHKHQRTRKTPCLGSMVEDQSVDTVIVNPDEVMMDWEIEDTEMNPLSC